MNPYRPLLLPEDKVCPICDGFVDKSTRLCLSCHQRFWDENNLPILEENIVYISITTFIGWIGNGPVYHMAFNVLTKEYAAIKISEHDEETCITIPQRMVNKLCDNTAQLFFVKEPQELICVNDCSSFHVNVQQGKRKFVISIDDFRLGDWPLFKQLLVNLKLIE